MAEGLLARIARLLGGARWRPTHRHRKGGLYRVVSRAVWEPDRSPCVIYDDAEGNTWVRPAAEFDDGRFTPLSAVRSPRRTAS